MGLEHLPGPAGSNLARHREALAHPALEPGPPRLGVVGLARLVILAPDQEKLFGRPSLLPRRMEPNVVVRPAGVVVEGTRHGARANRRRDHVGALRRLLRME